MSLHPSDNGGNSFKEPIDGKIYDRGVSSPSKTKTKSIITVSPTVIYYNKRIPKIPKVVNNRFNPFDKMLYSVAPTVEELNKEIEENMTSLSIPVKYMDERCIQPLSMNCCPPPTSPGDSYIPSYPTSTFPIKPQINNLPCDEITYQEYDINCDDTATCISEDHLSIKKPNIIGRPGSTNPYQDISFPEEGQEWIRRMDGKSYIYQCGVWQERPCKSTKIKTTNIDSLLCGVVVNNVSDFPVNGPTTTPWPDLDPICKYALSKCEKVIMEWVDAPTDMWIPPANPVLTYPIYLLDSVEKIYLNCTSVPILSPNPNYNEIWIFDGTKICKFHGSCGDILTVGLGQITYIYGPTGWELQAPLVPLNAHYFERSVGVDASPPTTFPTIIDLAGLSTEELSGPISDYIVNTPGSYGTFNNSISQPSIIWGGPRDALIKVRIQFRITSNFESIYYYSTIDGVKFGQTKIIVGLNSPESLSIEHNAFETLIMTPGQTLRIEFTSASGGTFLDTSIINVHNWDTEAEVVKYL